MELRVIQGISNAKIYLLKYIDGSSLPNPSWNEGRLTMTEKLVVRKVCMLGELAVGKTSLIKRQVSGIFDERYETTIGAKVTKAEMDIGGKNVSLIIWDLLGFLKYEKILASYFQGSQGAILTFDVTRMETLMSAERWAGLFLKDDPTRRVVMIGNKMDLGPDPEVLQKSEALAKAHGWDLMLTSAKKGENVGAAFTRLVERTFDGGQAGVAIKPAVTASIVPRPPF